MAQVLQFPARRPAADAFNVEADSFYVRADGRRVLFLATPLFHLEDGDTVVGEAGMTPGQARMLARELLDAAADAERGGAGA